MTTTQGRLQIPRAAAALRLPLWQRSQQRMRERYGFDMDSADALDRSRTLAGQSPGDAELALLLGSVLATRGEVDLAEMEVRRALDLAPRLPRAHTTLATLLMNRGDQAAALTSARAAAALDKDDPTVLYNLGLAEWFAGEKKTAKAAFARADEALRATATPGTEVAAPRGPWWRRGRG